MERARYGITGKGMGRVEVTLDLVDGKPTLEFITGAKAPVKLQLTEEGLLVGTIEVKCTKCNQLRPMTLKKIK